MLEIKATKYGKAELTKEEVYKLFEDKLLKHPYWWSQRNLDNLSSKIYNEQALSKTSGTIFLLNYIEDIPHLEEIIRNYLKIPLGSDLTSIAYISVYPAIGGLIAGTFIPSPDSVLGKTYREECYNLILKHKDKKIIDYTGSVKDIDFLSDKDREAYLRVKRMLTNMGLCKHSLKEELVRLDNEYGMNCLLKR